MSQKITEQTSTSSGLWEGLEALVREHVPRLIPALLEEEVTAVLGRPTATRRAAVDAPQG